MGRLEDLFSSLKEATEKVGEWKKKAEEALGDIRVTLSTTDEKYNPMRRFMQHMMINGTIEVDDLKGVLLPEDVLITLEKAMASGKVEWTTDFKIRIKSTGEDDGKRTEGGNSDSGKGGDR